MTIRPAPATAGWSTGQSTPGGPPPPPAKRAGVRRSRPWDRAWHNRKTRGSLTVTIDHSGTVSVTTVLGQTRSVTPYDYSPHLDASPPVQQRIVDDEPPPF